MNPQPVTVAAPTFIDAVLDQVLAGVSRTEAALLDPFARRFLARMSEEELAGDRAGSWAAIVRAMFEFIRQRDRDAAKVRVFNPARAADGWESGHTVILIDTDDMPFLVDSVGMALAGQDVQIHAINHPVVTVEREREGVLQRLDGEVRESLMYIEIDRQVDAGRMRAIEAGIHAALQDVRMCVCDWDAMQMRMRQIAEELPQRTLPVDAAGRTEAQEFLRWAADGHFIFLGYREYLVERRGEDEVLRAQPESGLGVLRGNERLHPPRVLKTLAAHYMPQSGSVDALILTKTNSRSTVHRPGYMDYIGVLSFDAEGRPVAEQRFIGLYTSSAYTRRPWDIPLVRQRHDYVLQRSGLTPASHSWKALRHILETLPREELFQAGEEELYQTCMGILGLQERMRTRLFLRRDRYGRFYSALAFIPRDRFNTEVRLRIGDLLKDALAGDRLDSTVAIGESPLAQLHLIIRPRPGEHVEADVKALEQAIVRIVRDWHDELRDLLLRRHGEHRGLTLTNRYGKALPAGYIEEATPEIAADDVERLAAISGADDLRLSLYRSRRADRPGLRFKLIRPGGDIPLSDALPMMENLGLRILAEHPYAIAVEGRVLHIQDFEVVPARGDVEAEALAERFEAAFEQTWRGRAESDGFNRLVLAAAMDWRQVAMLRGYCKSLLQIDVPFSQPYMEEALCRHPLLARLLVELFEARFDPARSGLPERPDRERERLASELRHAASDEQRKAMATVVEEVAYARGMDRDAQIDACHDGLAILLETVRSLDDDRILRSFIGVIDATLRTNYYCANGGEPREYISFKFDPAVLPDLPKPRPFREIFVYSPRVEGVHLRFGPVARGGLRWSDRREDFRTEVLGLVKAQMVKNTVIVPVGAKGGFFVKRPPADGDRDAVLAEGIACYRAFVNGLLDITDNYVDGGVAHPEGVVRRDGDDPYLVVAADKGTASFSDIANAISLERGFWLGDAFASGGSAGYDHKGMAITARGAWESVKRHFRALGVDCQSRDFTVAGIGDMSGDVFGNGMLLSRHIRLVAAFDHRHVFIDPNPDPETSYRERERLFRLPRSSWDDYDKSLISEGGGVFPRSAKYVVLSEPAKRALGIDAAVSQMTPAELLSAILKAPVDLLWNGGIGTYVKASGESHAEAGDRANNAIRIDGRELRCKVVGEGGNLGLTQRGRIEAALQAGVLLNTDFIDNSAGVDTSDHEVNIKILLDGAIREGRLDPAERNALLASMTDEVADLVLVDNYRQSQAISLMERMSVPRLGAKQHFIRTLEAQGLLDRQIEHLPSDAELSARKARGHGLTRPELSILLSYAKIVIYQQMLESYVPEDPYLSKELLRYFPQALQDRFGAVMEGHRLRREIIATAVTNSMVNRMGATFLLRMQEDTGETPAQIAQAYTISREVLDARDMWAGIDALDLKVPEAAQIDALLAIWTLQRQMTRWLLNLPGLLTQIAAAVDRFRPGMLALRRSIEEVLAGEALQAYLDDRRRWQESGFPEALAADLASLPYLASALDIVALAAELGGAVDGVARVFFRLGQVLHLDWLLARIEELPVEGRWHAHARGVLRDELRAQQTLLVKQVLTRHGAEADPVAAWVGREDPALRFTLNMFADIRSQRAMDYPTMQVAVRRLAQLTASPAC